MAASTRTAGIHDPTKAPNYSVITLAETNQLKTGDGKVAFVHVWDVGTTFVLTLYDATAGTTQEMWSWLSADGKGRFELNIPFGTGLRAISSGTPGKIGIVWE